MFSVLASKLANQFDSTIRNRGLRCYEERAVRIVRGSADGVTAQVRGSRNYETAVHWKDGALTVECSCPYFESNGPCKHLWATVLAARQGGYLSQVGAVRTVLLGGEPGDADFDADDLEAEWPDRNRASTLQRSRLTSMSRPPARKPSSWKSRIEEISNGAGRLCSSAATCGPRSGRFCM
jgi:hypothetical protein